MSEHNPPGGDAPRAADSVVAPARGWRAFAPDEIARLRRLYYDPKISLSKIAIAFGVATSTLHHWVDGLGWPHRTQLKREAARGVRALGVKAAESEAYRARLSEVEVDATDGRRPSSGGLWPPPSPREERGEEDASEPPPVAPEDFAGLCTAVGAETLRELAYVRARRRAGEAAPGNARTLASLVRTLAALEALRARRGDPKGFPPGGPPARPVRSLPELKADLIAKLQKLLAERAAEKAAREDAGNTPS